MATQTLKIMELDVAPFSKQIQQRMESAFKPLIDSGDLTIDFTGKAKDAKYTLTFEKKYDWSSDEHVGCGFRPFAYGMTGSVYVEAHTRANWCTNVTNCRTCEALFRRSPDELGKALAHTAVHEAGHLFGLMDKASYTGADDSGHSGDARNFMFAIPNHKDYQPPQLDSKRTKKYVIVEGDALSKIAGRIGFGFVPPREGWRTLYDFKGKDGSTNRQLLRSGDPDLIFPGEQIWIPDAAERAKFIRSIVFEEKTFLKSQLDTMRQWLKAGRSIFDSP
jgi:nucleoid-associated protein YgaU